MRKIGAFLFILSLLLPVSVAEASSTTVELDNFFYAHGNEPGNLYFIDKYADTTIYGDSNEHDALIQSITFSKQGMTGENLVVKTPDGEQHYVSGSSITFSPGVENVQILLVKTTSSESFAKVTSMVAYDSSDGGITVTYNYNGTPYTSYGDLGGTEEATATPTPTPEATATPTPEASYVTGTLHATWAGNQSYEITWTTPPDNTAYIGVWKDGTKIATYTPDVLSHQLTEGERDGTYIVKAVSSDGNVIAQDEVLIQGADMTSATEEPAATADTGDTDTDTGDTGEEVVCDTESCQTIYDALECPYFDEYLSEWAEAIGEVIPPAPDWEEVADTMRDSIVPAMGQEIVDRAPEIAEIIADELESRETPVEAPGAIPSFDPETPRFTDGASVTDSLDSDVPDYTPDYSEDTEGFTIPDPLDIDWSDTSDPGYTTTETDEEDPDYTQTETPTGTEPPYVTTLHYDEETKSYSATLSYPDDAPDYAASDSSDDSAAPDYETTDGTSDSQDYESDENNTIPSYTADVEGGE